MSAPYPVIVTVDDSAHDSAHGLGHGLAARGDPGDPGDPDGYRLHRDGVTVGGGPDAPLSATVAEAGARPAALPHTFPGPLLM